MLKFKIVSSLEKAFIDESIDKFEALERISVLKGERFSLQLLYTYEDDENEFYQQRIYPELRGALAKYATFHTVHNVPVVQAVTYNRIDDNYLRTTPGLYPDMLEPLHYHGEFRVRRGCLESVWIEFNIPEDCAEVGENELTLHFIDRWRDGIDMGYEQKLTVEVIDAALPEQKLILTQWFHCDCLAQYYNVPVWSERHWEIIESFAKVAV